MFLELNGRITDIGQEQGKHMELVPRELLLQSLLQLWEVESTQIKVGDQEDVWFSHSIIYEISQTVVSNTLKDFLLEGCGFGFLFSIYKSLPPMVLTK